MLIDRKARPRHRQGTRPRSRRSLTIALTIGLVSAGPSVAAQTVATAATTGISCRSLNIPVSLAAGVPKTYSIFGVMCAPSSGHTSTVQVLVPGGTYDHIYWDMPYENGRYSYLRYAAEHGYTALAIDPIGTGQSSHPLSALLTLNVNAFTVHEIVQDLRANGLGSSPYAKVMLVGHSYGSFTNWVEAATYKDVNADLDTGALHGINPVGAAQIAANLSEPAYLDPSGRFHGYDPAYLTTWPNTRGSFFYNTANADPRLIAIDEATKAAFATTELATFPLPIALGTTSNINVPVLVAAGQKDAIFCGLTADDCSTSATLLKSEAPYFAPAACLRSFVLPNAGHDVNLHLNSTDFYAAAIAWSGQVVGTGSSPAPGCAGLSS